MAVISEEIVYIGNGLCRMVVTSKLKRNRFAHIPDVQIHDNRVIFPQWMNGGIHQLLTMKRRRTKRDAEQLEML